MSIFLIILLRSFQSEITDGMQAFRDVSERVYMLAILSIT